METLNGTRVLGEIGTLFRDRVSIFYIFVCMHFCFIFISCDVLFAAVRLVAGLDAFMNLDAKVLSIYFFV